MRSGVPPLSLARDLDRRPAGAVPKRRDYKVIQIDSSPTSRRYTRRDSEPCTRRPRHRAGRRGTPTQSPSQRHRNRRRSASDSRYRHPPLRQCIEASKRVRWDIERDVIRGRRFDFGKKFLPDGLSRIGELGFLAPTEARFLSQVQGRTYANMFALVERFIGPKMLEISRGHWLGDQVALEALVRLTDEELKHQEMFRRLETMMAPGMPAGYRFLPHPNDVAGAVLAASSWAVLWLTLYIELFSQAHYRSSIEPETQLDSLWKDVFLFHGERNRSTPSSADGVDARGRKARRAATRQGRG
jgi:hypothetical protein